VCTGMPPYIARCTIMGVPCGAAGLHGGGSAGGGRRGEGTPCVLGGSAGTGWRSPGGDLCPGLRS
jgi:hypothetical protein